MTATAAATTGRPGSSALDAERGSWEHRLVPPVSRRLLALLVVIAGAAAAPAGAAPFPAACHPPGSRVIDGSAVRYHRVTWFCATHPRRLVALPAPANARYVGNVVARGRFLAFSFYADTSPDCDGLGVGARSIDRNTGEIVRALPTTNACVDVYADVITDLALRSINGDFAVIRQLVDNEDDQGSATVLAVTARGPRVIDDQDKRQNDSLNETRIFGHSLYYDGRLHYKRADGRQRRRL